MMLPVARAKMAQAHYDAATLAHRNTSSRSELQRFHNDAKRALLGLFAKDARRLLDLACGRGGDIHKWRAQGIPQVLGLDCSEESVKEARARCASSLRAGQSGYSYSFEQADLRTPWRGPAAAYDVVTCMFALHYFFESEAVAHALFKTVSDNLRAGGHFVGIVPDGLRVNERIKFGPFDNGIACIQAGWHGKPACFGSAYTFAIQGTITEASSAPEYLVYGDVLRALAGVYGLEPVRFECPEFHGAATDGVFHHLRPPYDGPMREITGTYAGFAFRKKHGA
jgi:mRNA (guanine-N7-)-methyltransferase